MQKSASISEAQLHRLGLTVVGNEAIRLVDTRPDEGWEPERLAAYAKGELATSVLAEQEAILQCHKSAVHLFRAGHAYSLLRVKCKKKHGEWTTFKRQHSLKTTTVNDAIRLYEGAKTEDALLGLGITEAKDKFVYPAKGKVGEDERQSKAVQRKTGRGTRGGRADPSRTGEAGHRGEESSEADPSPGDRQDGDEAVETLADEIEGIAQRLSEIAQDDMGKVHWSAAERWKANNAIAAVEKYVVVIHRRLNDECQVA